MLDRALAGRAPVGGDLAAAAAGREDRDARLLSELVLGTLRWLARLDQVLESAGGRSTAEIDPRLLAPLRIGAYQILFLDRVPAYAAVDEAVAEARSRAHKGAAGFVNAVLRKIARRPRLEAWPIDESDPITRLAIETSHPLFLVERWVDRWGEERARQILEANNQPAGLDLLAFGDRGGRFALADALAAEGVEASPAPLAPLALSVGRGDPRLTEAWVRGDAYIQDRASQLAALIPLPRPGERVLDAAAAPGGKSFSLIAREPALRPVLADLSLERALRMRENLTRLRRSLRQVVADAQRPAFSAHFDRVILDLPCTGTGTLRRHPELKWRLSAQEIGRLADQAWRMLERSATLLRPGGLLIAITCSLEPEENEDVVRQLLARRPDLALCPLAGRVPESAEAHIRGPGFWRLFTSSENDGFTLHALERTGS